MCLCLNLYLLLLLLLSSLGGLLGPVLVLRDLDRLLPLVVGVVGDVLDKGVDERVLVQGLGADHHVGLAVAVLAGDGVGDLD